MKNTLVDNHIKNILVTGGCGFIGSNFLNIMVDRYPDIHFVNIDAMYYCASLANITVADRDNYTYIKGDINSYDLVSYILKENNIDTIIHFAAQSHVDDSFLEPLKYVYDNVRGTTVLLEATKHAPQEILFFHFSTDEVYGESGLNDDKPKCEQTILCPTNPYAATKAAAEMMVNSYAHSFNIPTIITRGNNVYGPNQYPEKLVPKFIQFLKGGDKCTIHGDGSTVRSFIHVFDVVDAVDIIMRKGTIGEIYNIGSAPEYELSVLDITQRLVKLIHGSEADYEDWITFVADRPFNDKRYFINNDKLKALGWTQKVSVDEGLSGLV